MLASSKFLCDAVTTNKYELFAGFTYPALIHAEGEGSQVEGELYLVDEETMKFLDIYEGVDSGLYKCEKIELASVSAGDYFTGRHEIYSYFYYGNMKNFRKIQKWTCI
jgi:gamma-glutamylcyclotransferase (GGCT)/AIG2-like uncharacterized protein YtfP